MKCSNSKARRNIRDWWSYFRPVTPPYRPIAVNGGVQNTSPIFDRGCFDHKWSRINDKCMWADHRQHLGVGLPIDDIISGLWRLLAAIKVFHDKLVAYACPLLKSTAYNNHNYSCSIRIVYIHCDCRGNATNNNAGKLSSWKCVILSAWLSNLPLEIKLAPITSQMTV